MITIYIFTYTILMVIFTSAGYLFKGWFSWFYHDKLNWHIPRENSIITDGVTRWAICKYCGEVIQQNENGIWI